MATMAEMMIEIGVDPSELDRGAQRAQNDMRSIGTSVATLADNMDTSMADIRRQWRGMSEEMRNAHRQNAAALAPFRAEQQQIQYEFFQMAQGMGEYQGSTEDFMNQLTELGRRNSQVNNNMMANNNMARMGFIQGIATMLAASTQSSRISSNFDRMNNPLYRVNNGLLAVSGGLERIAARGQPAALALRMLGPTASMRDLNNMTMMITNGIMRMNAVALVAAIGAGLLYAKLASAASEAVPGFKQAADQMKASLGKAFEPMVQVFASVVTPIMNVITAIANLAIKFNEAHPFLAKLIAGFLLLIPLLTLILAPLAIGIGLFGGLQAAFAALWPVMMPVITGFATMMGTVLLVAGVIVALVAVGYLLYKHWDTIKAKATEIWGSIKTFFVNLWASMVSGAQTIWSSITGFFSSLWSGIKSIFFTVINYIANYVRSRFGYILSAIRTILNNAMNIIKNIWNIIKNIFLGVVLVITDIITGDFGSIKGHVSQIMGNIKSSISSIWSSIKTIFTTYVGAVKTYAVNTFNGMKNLVTNAFNALKSGVIKAASAIKNDVVSQFNALKSMVTTVATSVKEAVVSAFTKAKSFLSGIDLGQIGKNIIQGLINGIKSMASAVANSIKNVASGIKSGIKGALGIHSPSRWMRDMIGKNISLGMALGIEAESGSVFDSLDAITDEIKGYTALGVEEPNLPRYSNQFLSNEQTRQPVYIIELEGRPIAKGILPHVVDQIRLKTGIRN